jgi:Peptidase family M28
MLAAIFIISFAATRPLPPKSSTAAVEQFSAARARDTLHRILGDDVPHPIGSAANAGVRTRIMDELAQLGYRPQVQSGFACSEYGDCAAVNNVLGRLDGTHPDGAVLLAAHYDSVSAGPGDSDDGAGVAAVLEIARALKSLPQPRHSIILLIDEGEEEGLLGARAFVSSHPWAKEVRAAVNLDARGTSGPALMFETGGNSEWAVSLYARGAARPATSSIFETAYRYLPNGTDFTIFKDAGFQGLNFAFIGDEVHYHTPLDNSANVNPASVQHLGENALSSIVALADAEVPERMDHQGVYFDLFGRRVIVWSASTGRALAFTGAILLLAQIGWMIQRKRLTPGEFFWGATAWLVTMAVAGALAIIASRLMRFAGAAPVNWVAHPRPVEITFWSLAVAAVIANAVFFARRAQFWGLWAGVWAWLALIAVLTSRLAPGLSYLALLPVCLAALAGLPFTLRRKEAAAGSSLIVLLPLAAAAIIGYRPLVLLYDAFGNRGLPLATLLVALLLTSLAPLCADVRELPGLRGQLFLWVPAAAVAASAFAAAVVPAYSAKAPERLNMEYWQETDTGVSQWIVQSDSGALPEPIRLAANFRRAPQGALPWSSHPSFVATAPRVDLAPPTFTVLESSQAGARRSYRTLLRSERGAPFAAALFPPLADIESVRMGDQPLPPEASRIRDFYNGWTAYSCPAMPPGGIEISFSVPIGKPIEISAVDQTYGLPAEGAFLLNSRPLTATPFQNGDVTIVSRRVQLLP